MKRYVFTIACILISLALAAQSGQSSGISANVEAVDLGLPSGTRWATCNVGANSPENLVRSMLGEKLKKKMITQARTTCIMVRILVIVLVVLNLT